MPGATARGTATTHAGVSGGGCRRVPRWRRRLDRRAARRQRSARASSRSTVPARSPSAPRSATVARSRCSAPPASASSIRSTTGVVAAGSPTTATTRKAPTFSHSIPVVVGPSATSVGSGATPGARAEPGDASETHPDGLACHGGRAGPGGPSQKTSSASVAQVRGERGRPRGSLLRRQARDPPAGVIERVGRWRRLGAVAGTERHRRRGGDEDRADDRLRVGGRGGERPEDEGVERQPGVEGDGDGERGAPGGVRGHTLRRRPGRRPAHPMPLVDHAGAPR